jgi:hypothetical protein
VRRAREEEGRLHRSCVCSGLQTTNQQRQHSWKNSTKKSRFEGVRQ